MRIDNISIKKFRSIKDMNISLSNVTALVGGNNAGKSSVLRALNAFFNYDDERTYFMDGAHSYSSNSKTFIELTFSEIPSKVGLTKIKQNSKIIIKFSHTKGGAKYQYLKNKQYHPLPRDKWEAIQRQIAFIFIPPARDHTQISRSENSILNTLIDTYLDQKTSQRDRLSKPVKQVVREMDDKVLKVINSQLNEQLPINSSGKIRISFADEGSYRTIFQSYQLLYQDTKHEFDMQHVGSGIQSLSIIAMYRYLANLQHRRFIIGFEEPETNLHPQSQRALISEIKKYTGDANNGNVQILLTTHSIPIVDELKHHQLVLVRRQPCEAREFFTIGSQVSEDFFRSNGLNDEESYKSLRFNNSEFQFAKHVYLVEGEGDRALIEAIAENEKIDLNAEGISILSLSGKGNILYPVKLLTTLNIPFTFLCDKDFFLPYLHNEYKPSVLNGEIKYKNQLDAASRKLLKYLGLSDNKCAELCSNLHSQHMKALTELKEINIISYKMTLEADIVRTTRGFSELRALLPPVNPALTVQEILTTKSVQKKMKKSEIIFSWVKKLPLSSYPYSLKYIRNDLLERIK